MKLALAALLLAGALPMAAQAEKAPAGRYVQASSNAGDCATCEIELIQVAPDLLHIKANNDWSGVAAYEPRSGQYMGYSQYQAGMGGDYGGPPMEVIWTYARGVLSMKAEGGPGPITATYRRKR